MTSDRWERVKALFQGALAQPPDERRAWLEQACAGDRGLLQEAATLLQSLETAGDFLEQPAPLDAGPLDILPPGTVIGPYRVVRDIGRGGMGVVYLAEDVRLGRRVALKALPQEVAGNPELRQRLRREARAAATISHPAVATVYALEEIDDHLIIVSEYVEGETLRGVIARGAVDEEKARGLAGQIAGALCAAHEAGVVHRDLKPENVLVNAGGGVKVVDFGIAHIEGPEATKLTRAGAMLGTPAYMAPEQLLGSRVDGRSDIYAFGVLLSEMLTGRHPLNRGPASTAVPPALDAIIARCTQPDPDARFGSARELLQALDLAGSAKAGHPGPSEAGHDDDVGGDEGAPNTPRPDVVSGWRRTDANVAPGFSRTGTTAIGSPRWWWEFHQAAAAIVYGVMVVPAWRARELLGSPWGRVFFIVLLVAVIVASILRLNLWFTSRFYRPELRWARRRAARWIRAADWAFVLTLAAGGLAVGDERSPIAVVLISVAIGAALAFLMIERVTTRAAFRSSPTPKR